jgi:hypothetical protein
MGLGVDGLLGKCRLFVYRPIGARIVIVSLRWRCYKQTSAQRTHGAGPRYAWEGMLETPWLNVREDEEGRLVSEMVDHDEHWRRRQHEIDRQRLAVGQSVRRGLIRWVSDRAYHPPSRPACPLLSLTKRAGALYKPFLVVKRTSSSVPPNSSAQMWCACPVCVFLYRYVYLALDFSSAMHERHIYVFEVYVLGRGRLTLPLKCGGLAA